MDNPLTTHTLYTFPPICMLVTPPSVWYVFISAIARVINIFILFFSLSCILLYCNIF